MFRLSYVDPDAAYREEDHLWLVREGVDMPAWLSNAWDCGDVKRHPAGLKVVSTGRVFQLHDRISKSDLK